MAIAREEVFGPVLSVLTFRDFDEAVALANGAAYGLSAGVWSENVHTCLAFARKAQAGTVWTNTWMDGFPEVTFGDGWSAEGKDLTARLAQVLADDPTLKVAVVGHTDNTGAFTYNLDLSRRRAEAMASSNCPDAMVNGAASFFRNCACSSWNPSIRRSFHRPSPVNR